MTEPTDRPAPPPASPADPAGGPAEPVRVGLPSQVDPVVRAASGAIGGPWGRHGAVGTRQFWTPLRVLLAFAVVTLSFAYLQKSPCQTGVWNHGLQYTHLCYTDVVPLYFSEDLNSGAVPYRDHPVEYPVLTGAFMGVSAWLSEQVDELNGPDGLLPDMPPVQTYFTITSILLSVALLVTVWSTALLARRRMWDAAMVALAPLLIFHAFTNWDLLAIGLVGVGMLAWARDRPALAGVLFGLGAAAKLYPALFLIPLLALCLRTRKMTAWWWAAGGTVVGWLAVNLPVALAYNDAWGVFFDRNESRPADFDSIWYVLVYLWHQRSGTSTGPVQVNWPAAVAVCIVLAAVFLLAFYAHRRPRVPQLLFLTVAAFLLANKVWSPQYSLWLVPLAVLARPSWRSFLAWQAAESLLWVPRLLWFLGAGSKGIEFHWFLLAVVVRDAALITYCVLVIMDILQPERDIVRADGSDDPAGGPLDGAPDVAYGTSAPVPGLVSAS